MATVSHELNRVGPGYPGAHRMREEIADWPVGDVRPDSVLEVAFARLCRQAALPAPLFQYELVVGGKVRRVDFAYPDLRLAIEVVGLGCRTDRDYFQDERSRHNDFVLDGWRILEFTWHDITRRPDHVIRVILSALADLQGASV